jgi:hypothetical protein
MWLLPLLLLLPQLWRRRPPLQWLEQRRLTLRRALAQHPAAQQCETRSVGKNSLLPSAAAARRARGMADSLHRPDLTRLLFSSVRN